MAGVTFGENKARRIRRLRVLLIAAVALGVVLAVVAVTIARVSSGRQQALLVRLDTRVATSAQFVTDYVAGVFAQEQQVSVAMLTGPVTAAGFSQLAAGDAYPAAVLLDSAGRLLAVQPSAPAMLGVRLGAKYVHLSGALAGRPTASDVVPSAARGEPLVAFAVPFPTATGRRVFSFGYPIARTPLTPFIENALSLKGSRALLLDSAGTVIASSDASLKAGSKLTADRQLAVAVAMTRGYATLDGRRAYVTSAAVAGTPWRLVFTTGTAALFAPLQGPGQWFPLFVLAGLGVAAAMALALWWRSSAQRDVAVATEQLREAILNTAVDAFFGMTDAAAVADWNTASQRLFGWTAAEALGRQITEFLVVPDSRTDQGAALRQFFDSDDRSLPDRPMELTALHRDGHEIPVELSVSRVQWQDGWRYNGFLRDITQRREHETQLRQLALSDPLTGLANRRVALDRLTHALTRTHRHANSVAVLYIDIDHFKDINDTHGHTVGDAFLITVADRLRATFRTEDTITRLGGDEFAVICEDLHDTRFADRLLERTTAALAEPYHIGDLHITASAAVGLATGTDTIQPETLLARADAAMYAAKAAREITQPADTANTPHPR